MHTETDQSQIAEHTRRFSRHRGVVEETSVVGGKNPSAPRQDRSSSKDVHQNIKHALAVAAPRSPAFHSRHSTTLDRQAMLCGLRWSDEHGVVVVAVVGVYQPRPLALHGQLPRHSRLYCSRYP